MVQNEENEIQDRFLTEQVNDPDRAPSDLDDAARSNLRRAQQDDESPRDHRDPSGHR